MLRDGVRTLRRPGRISNGPDIVLYSACDSRESHQAFSFFVSGR